MHSDMISVRPTLHGVVGLVNWDVGLRYLEAVVVYLPFVGLFRVLDLLELKKARSFIFELELLKIKKKKYINFYVNFVPVC